MTVRRTRTSMLIAASLLVAFVVGCAARRLRFKLTAGLHHAVRGRYAVDGIPEENHGVLDVLVATAAALAGASAPELAALLAVRDSTALAGLVTSWPDATAAASASRPPKASRRAR